MTNEFDNLIRDARPTVPPSARERVLEHVKAHGAVAAAPGPFRVFLRVAALVVLALVSGVVAALVAPRDDQRQIELADLRERADGLDASLPADAPDISARLARIEAELADLEDVQAEQERVLREVVLDLVNERERARIEEWRERHVVYLRQAQSRRVEAILSELREELDLTEGQETQVRELFDEAGDAAVKLINDFYSRGLRGGMGLREDFIELAHNVERDLQELLNQQQRERIGEAAIVASSPEDWAPRDEFRDGTDMDVWLHWMTISRE